MSAGGSSSPSSSSSAIAVIDWGALQPQSSPPPRVGGFGVVYAAQWVRKRGPAVRVAVKILKVAGLGSKDFEGLLSLLEVEASVMQAATSDKTNQKNVVACYGVARGAAPPHWGSEALQHYAPLLEYRAPGVPRDATPALVALVMDYEGGGDLHALLHPPESGRVPWPAPTAERLGLLVKIARGLCFLHDGEPSIVHADLKPANVLLSDDGAMNPRLADFGFARVREAAAASVAMSSAAPVAGTAATAPGTWPYMAPELYRSRTTPALAPSRTSDIYAFGTLAWEVLSGRQPWVSDNFTATDRLVELGKPDGARLPMEALQRDTPASVRDLIVKCFELKRDERPSAAEVLSVLEWAHERLLGGTFDAFISYAWGAGKARQPLANAVYKVLQNEGIKCWFDLVGMGHDTVASMEGGVRASSVFIALLSPTYVSSGACMLEIRAAVAAKKPIIACLVESGDWEVWAPPGSEVATVAKLAKNMWVDLRRTLSANWARAALPKSADPAVWQLLTHADDAAPRLVRLLCDHGVRPTRCGPVAEAIDRAAVAAAERAVRERAAAEELAARKRAEVRARREALAAADAAAATADAAVTAAEVTYRADAARASAAAEAARAAEATYRADAARASAAAEAARAALVRAEEQMKAFADEAVCKQRALRLEAKAAHDDLVALRDAQGAVACAEPSRTEWGRKNDKALAGGPAAAGGAGSGPSVAPAPSIAGVDSTAAAASAFAATAKLAAADATSTVTIAARGTAPLVSPHAVPSEPPAQSLVYPGHPSYQDKSSFSNCRGCYRQFGMLRWKHHCRSCGCLFCALCAPKTSGISICLLCSQSAEIRSSTSSSQVSAAVSSVALFPSNFHFNADILSGSQFVPVLLWAFRRYGGDPVQSDRIASAAWSAIRCAPPRILESLADEFASFLPGRPYFFGENLSVVACGILSKIELSPAFLTRVLVPALILSLRAHTSYSPAREPSTCSAWAQSSTEARDALLDAIVSVLKTKVALVASSAFLDADIALGLAVLLDRVTVTYDQNQSVCNAVKAFALKDPRSVPAFVAAGLITRLAAQRYSTARGEAITAIKRGPDVVWPN